MRNHPLLLLFVFAILPFAAPSMAQQPTEETFENPTIAPIVPGGTVRDSITEAVIFDWWTITLNEGDTLQATMTGEQGLAPLLGLLESGNELVERSED
ncbi:MAG: hypothetical protein AAFV33_19300, partial [Chloroflexota bacterium]